jgi:hypothetical protein
MHPIGDLVAFRAVMDAVATENFPEFAVIE